MLLRKIGVSVLLALSLIIAGSTIAAFATGKKYGEAPMLAELVKQGKLPPVNERLPENPLVVKPVETVGRYGGDLKVGLLGPADLGTLYWAFFVEPLVRWNREGNGIIPNVAEKWAISDDCRTYTFYLRKGIRWSDGVPLTADDILFWYESILLNKELTPTIPTWLASGKDPVKVQKVDTYTIRFQFSKPNVLFLENIAFMAAQPGNNMIRPKHYLRQFHPDYVQKKKLEAMAQRLGFEHWYQLFMDRMDYIQNPDHPVITAWKSTGPLAGKTLHVLQRNPYYWKVDPQGNQLPYIDKIVAQIVENVEVLNAKVISGEIDLDFGHLTLPNYPLLKENQEKGGYRVLLWKKAMGSQLAFMPNLNHKDPAKRKVFEDKRFRIALSLAINREEINELCFLGLAEIRHATVAEGCPYYTKGIEKLYIEYNPKKANALLDEMGLNRRDKNGFRLGPDGKPFTITIEYPPHTEFGPWEDMIKLVADYWNAIGIKTAIKPIDRSLYEIRTQTTDIDMVLWSWARGLHPLIDPAFVFPCKIGHFTGAPLYALWYSSRGSAGEKPSGDILKVMQLYDEFCSTVDESKRIKIGQEIITHISHVKKWDLSFSCKCQD